jgi:hypothetical protein
MPALAAMEKAAKRRVNSPLSDNRKERRDRKDQSDFHHREHGGHRGKKRLKAET